MNCVLCELKLFFKKKQEKVDTNTEVLLSHYLEIPSTAIGAPGFGHTHAKGDHGEVRAELLLPVHVLLPSNHIHS